MSAQYRFDTYKSNAPAKGPRVLLTSDVGAIAPMLAEMPAVALVRDLVNTPAADMGPEALEKAAESIATAHGGELDVDKGAAPEEADTMVTPVRTGARQEARRVGEKGDGRQR